jgi:iron complex transport system substrate-binding protein
MMKWQARLLLALCALALLAPAPTRARTVTDSAGRTVTLPDKITRVMAAGPPASAVVYCLRPEAMVGWQRSPRKEELPYLLPSTHALPELGRLTGRGDTANVEIVLKANPDVIVDFGSLRPTFVSLADATQQRTGIPYVLVDGRFDATPSSLRLLGSILGVPERGDALASYTEELFQRIDKLVAAIPEQQRPSVYLARGPRGLETGLRGSINAEIIERAGGRNVAVSDDRRQGIANVSPEQILLWAPEVIVTWDRNFFDAVTRALDATWSSVPAVRNKRVYLAPTAPFGWIDGPPSVNRLIGLAWLAHLLHGEKYPFDIRVETRKFYKLFYQVELTDRDLETLIAWSDGKPPQMPERR